MKIATRERWHRRSGARPRWLALIMALAVGLTAVLTAPPAGAVGQDPWVSVPEPGYYRFTVPAAAAAAQAGATPVMVAAEGNFGPGRTWAQLNLSLSNGNWTGTIGPLDPGLYYFQYEATIAGEEKLVAFRNPAAPQDVTAKPTWSTFFVPGPAADWLADIDGGGRLDTLAYEGADGRTERSALVWTPPGYDEDRARPYPVLYLLADVGQSSREWAELGRAGQILDNLAADDELASMVVVMADAGPGDGRDEVLDALVPAARDALNVSDDPAGQAIAGVGRGATQALNLLITDPGEFTKVGSLSGGLAARVSKRDAVRINRATDLIRLYVGNTTDPAYNRTAALIETFDRAHVDYEFDGVNPEAGGTWDTWQESLRDFASRLFRKVRDHGMSDGHRPLRGPHTLPEPGTTPTPWIDRHDVVTFETGTEYADAKNVTVWANFAPGGSWLRVPMTKSGDRWRTTIGPLDPGFYYYKFIVDRVDKKDTSNPVRMTTEVNWSAFMIEGDEAPARYLSDAPKKKGGKLSTLTYQSTVVGAERKAYVWTPPGYDPNRKKPYPVLFLQHGGGQSYTDWVEVGRAKQILDHHSIDGTITPMVVVMGNGNVGAGSNFPNELLNNIIPAAEAAYNISSDPSQRALAGLSMGGGHTATTLKAHPGKFAYIGIFSAGFGSVEGIDVAAINRGTKLLQMYVGDITDFVYPGAMNSMRQMDEAGIEYEFDGITIGPHGWDAWQKNLIDFLPRLFK